MTRVDQTLRWSAVGLPLLAAAAVAASIVSPLTALVAGPTLLIASGVVYRSTQASGLRRLALVTSVIGVALSILVALVGLVLIAV